MKVGFDLKATTTTKSDSTSGLLCKPQLNVKIDWIYCYT